MADNKQILLIEDDNDIRSSLIELLEGEGYTVAAAANGQEGIDYLSGGLRPALILLDLMMPIKDGFEFRAEQRHHPAWGKIPVVIMSADGHVQQKLLQVGVETYLKKPVDIDAVLETIARYCAA